jgi:hypothetical protein
VEPEGLVKVAGPPPTTNPWISDAMVVEKVTALVRGEMEAGLGPDVTLDTLDLKVTSVDGETWEFQGVATAHPTTEGGTIVYDVAARFVPSLGLAGCSWSPKKG